MTTNDSTEKKVGEEVAYIQVSPVPSANRSVKIDDISMVAYLPMPDEDLQIFFRDCKKFKFESYMGNRHKWFYDSVISKEEVIESVNKVVQDSMAAILEAQRFALYELDEQIAASGKKIPKEWIENFKSDNVLGRTFDGFMIKKQKVTLAETCIPSFFKITSADPSFFPDLNMHARYGLNCKRVDGNVDIDPTKVRDVVEPRTGEEVRLLSLKLPLYSTNFY